MVSVGRVVCVSLPFVLAVVSIVALLVATLAGITDKSMHMFEVNTTDLSISASDALSLVTKRIVLAPTTSASSSSSRSVGFHDTSLLISASTSSSSSSDSNITASDLGLGNLYRVNLWNYCVTEQNGTRTCSTPKFDWAAKTLNNSEHTITSLISSTGVNVTLPKDVRDAIKVYTKLAKWTEVVYLIAFVALALEIALGLFTSCSQGVACLTFVVAIITVVAVVAAAAMSTAMSSVVVAAIKTAAHKYGVTASFDTNYLAAVWIAAAAAVAASFFWMFTVCCCKPEKRARAARSHSSSSRGGVATPLVMGDKTGAYQPLHDESTAGFAPNAYAPQYGQPRFPQGGRSDLAYEPYSHQRA